MKFSLNWVKQVTPIEVPIDELVAKIGSQLGEIESVTDLGPKYKGVVIVKVMSCEDHPDADRLHVCMVDDGGVVPDVPRDDKGLVQVVCGAPNVTAGVTVAWLPPGSTVPDSFDGEPFVLTARELRGVVSNGMLASPKELAIGDSHEGLLLLDDDKKAGESFAEAYGLNDYVIDIENKMFTHRPDLFGQLGIAREIAAILGQQFNSPDWYKLSSNSSLGQASNQLPLEVHNELPELVARFMAVALSDIVIKPSDIYTQSLLSRSGIRPINNVVDVTNLLMIITGQPIHAYDYDKVRALSSGETAVIVVRNPRESEKISLLNGKTIDPRQEAIMIATDKQLIGIGGVMGGADTEVDATTKNIILEVATFDMYSVRRTSMAHGLFTDAVTRNNKGQSPLQNPAVLAETLRMLGKQANATQASEIADNNQVVGREWVHPPVPVQVDFINSRLGLSLTTDEIKQLLEHVEFEVAHDDNKLTVTAPFWRTDIEQREDIVEEVGRLYGYDKLPLELPRRSILPASKDPLLSQKERIRASLARAGANEVLSYSFVHGKLLDAATQSKEQAFKVSNALSPDLQYYRLHALPSLLDKVHPNIKAGYDEFALFELNKGHNLLHKDDDDGVPTEIEFLDFVYASSKKQPGSALFRARRFLDALAADFDLTFSYTEVSEDPHVPVSDPYDYKRSAYVSVVGGEFLGMVGELKPSVLKALKLPAQTAVFTIGQSQLLESTNKATATYTALPRFPKVNQDICLRVATSLHYQELYDFVGATLESVKSDSTRLTIQPIDAYQRPDNAEHKQITFRITVANYEKTMTDAEVAKLLDAAAQAAAEKFAAERV